MARRGSSTTANRFAVKQVELGARPLVTIGPDNHVWLGLRAETGSWSDAAFGQWLERCKRAIVRVQPPHDATDAELVVLQAALARVGVEQVRVDARQPGPELPRQEAPVEKSTPREVVMRLAERSARAAELKALLDAELGKVAL